MRRMETCLTVLILILSIPILVLGILMVIFASLVLTGNSAVGQFFQPWLDIVVQRASDATGRAVTTANFKLNVLMGPLDDAAVGVGAYLTLVGVLGLVACIMVFSCSTCCRRTIIPMIIYDVFAALTALLAIAFVYVAAGQQVLFSKALGVEGSLLTQLQTQYEGVDGNMDATIAWNAIMNGLQCCGINDNTDFATSTWQTNNPGLTTPISCCKQGETISAAPTCATTPDTSISNFEEGCFERVWSYLFDGVGFTVTAFLLIGVPVLEFALALSFIILYKCNRQKDYPLSPLDL